MTLTFISFQQAVIWLLTTALALCLYLWKVRPYLERRPEFSKFYALSNSWWKRVYVWLKIRWDLAVGAIIMALPALWNGILDGIIWLSLHAADFLPALAGADLSNLVLPKWVETSIRLGGAAVPIIRAKLEGKGEE